MVLLAVAVQFFGDVGQVGFPGGMVAQLVDGAVRQSAMVNELDFCPGAQQLNGGMTAVLGGDAAVSDVAALSGVSVSATNLSADIDAFRHFAQGTDFNPEKTAVAVSVGGSLVLIVVFIDVEGELLREAGVDASFGHTAELGAGNALPND